MSIRQEFKEAYDWHITGKGVRVRVRGEAFLMPWGDGETLSGYKEKRKMK